MSPSPACLLGAGRDPSRPSEKPSRPSRKLPSPHSFTTHHFLNHMKLNRWQQAITANINAVSGRRFIAASAWNCGADHVAHPSFGLPAQVVTWYTLLLCDLVPDSRASSTPASRNSLHNRTLRVYVSRAYPANLYPQPFMPTRLPRRSG